MCRLSQADFSSSVLAHRESAGLSNTKALPSPAETISLKLTKEQAKLRAETSKEQGFPSKSEFVRYAIARALEERLSVKTSGDIFESRRQMPSRKNVPL